MPASHLELTPPIDSNVFIRLHPVVSVHRRPYLLKHIQPAMVNALIKLETNKKCFTLFHSFMHYAPCWQGYLRGLGRKRKKPRKLTPTACTNSRPRVALRLGQLKAKPPLPSVTKVATEHLSLTEGWRVAKSWLPVNP